MHLFPRNLFVVAKKTKSSEAKSELNRGQLLQLALAWDAIEVAKEHIIKDDLNSLDVRSKEISLKFFRSRFVFLLARNKREIIF